MTRAEKLREYRRRYRECQAGRLPPAQRSGRRLITRTTVSGETAISRCMREAREAVPASLAKWRNEPYGGRNHSDRRRYDMAVHAEFMQRLRAAGIEVEE